MPISGTGVVPSGALFNELAAATRRAFVPQLVVQLYFASPSLFYMMGNAQKAAGGLNQVTVPVQGQSMVQGNFTGYGGGFPQPVVIPGVQNGQWNLAYWVVPIPIPFGESVIQSTETVIPILKARMNDAYAVTKQKMATLLYTNNSSNPLFPDSFQSAFDNGTNFATYGGINRNSAGNSFWQGQYINMAAAPFTGFSISTLGMNRQSMATLIAKVTDAAGGEKPTAIVMNPGDYSTLNNSITGVENVYVTPDKEYGGSSAVIRSTFTCIFISGVPVFADHFIPQGNMFIFNAKYTAFYLSEDAAFDFSGFQSLIPLNQIGQQGIVVLGYDLISTKPISGAWAYGLGGNSF
jgi:hypothetical protein